MLEDKAMATSGTYRKFKIDKFGNKYAHIINTKTGYPSKTNILSVSVIADNCMMQMDMQLLSKPWELKKWTILWQSIQSYKLILFSRMIKSTGNLGL